MDTGPFDLVVRGGTLVDGTGGPSRRADVGIRGDRIVSLEPGTSRAPVELEADGRVVCPGFVNMLSWAGEALFLDGRGLSDLRQGVTLEVLGEGWSLGPLTPDLRDRRRRRQRDQPYEIDWLSLGEALAALERRGIAVNVASFVGATSVRVHELGFEDRTPRPEELARMVGLVDRAMAEGAVGLSSSLIYAPACYASTDELVALASAAAHHGGIYASHLRSEADRLLEGLEELLEISRRGDLPAEVYHLKAAGRANWPKLEAVIARVEEARATGQRITADMYPYPAAATGLDAAMPPWVQEGGFDAWRARLLDPVVRRRVEEEMAAPAGDWENFLVAAGAESIRFVGFRDPSLRPLEGRTLAEVAAETGRSPAATAIDLVVADRSRVETVYFLMSEENVRRQVALPWIAFGSDARAIPAEEPFVLRSTHPRTYGTFARVLGRYVRDEGLVSLEEAVRRLTSFPADTLGLVDRGRIAPGFFADLAIFDPDTIEDHATFESPHRYATGVDHVVVNGIPVLHEGQPTGALPGRFVRRERPTRHHA